MGVAIAVASEGRYSPIQEYYRGIEIDLADPDAAFAAIVSGVGDAVDAVIGTDDATVELACRVAAHYGLPGNPPAAAAYSRRKDVARARLREAGVPVPEFRVLDLQAPLAPQLERVDYPVVLKPVSMSASRGVIRCNNRDDLDRALPRVQLIAQEAPRPEERDLLLLESYLPGCEVAYEGLLDGGQLQTLALFDKPDPLEGPYFEETYYVTPSRLTPQQQAEIVERVAAACRAYGLREGPVHAELRIDGEQVWILEVASRTIGGQCGQMLRFGGQNLEDVVLLQALGRATQIPAHTEAAGVLMLPIARGGVLRRVEGVLAAQKIPGVEEVQLAVREGHRLVPLPEGNSYLGFIFARGPDPESVEAALRAAHACLRVVVAPLWELRPG